jgi:hypothetical protein
MTILAIFWGKLIILGIHCLKKSKSHRIITFLAHHRRVNTNRNQSHLKKDLEQKVNSHKKGQVK